MLPRFYINKSQKQADFNLNPSLSVRVKPGKVIGLLSPFSIKMPIGFEEVRGESKELQSIDDTSFVIGRGGDSVRPISDFGFIYEKSLMGYFPKPGELVTPTGVVLADPLRSRF